MISSIPATPFSSFEFMTSRSIYRMLYRLAIQTARSLPRHRAVSAVSFSYHTTCACARSLALSFAPGLFSPVEAAIIHEGLICLNMCVVRLVCLEQQWTVSVRGGGFMPLVALMLSAPSAVVSDDRLCLSLLMENPQRVYAADQNLLPFVYGVCL